MSVFSSAACACRWSASAAAGRLLWLMLARAGAARPRSHRRIEIDRPLLHRLSSASRLYYMANAAVLLVRKRESVETVPNHGAEVGIEKGSVGIK